jgi:small subunit ribosomal protein S6
MTNSYETIFILDATMGEEAIEKLTEKFKSLIEANGTVESVDVWGKRKLAYEINDMTEGHYVLINFTAEPAFPAELERIYNITDGVMRSLVVRKDA